MDGGVSLLACSRHWGRLNLPVKRVFLAWPHHERGGKPRFGTVAGRQIVHQREHHSAVLYNERDPRLAVWQSDLVEVAGGGDAIIASGQDMDCGGSNNVNFKTSPDG